MWILPSRGRPNACRALLAAMVARGMVGPGVLVCDADDPELAGYKFNNIPLPSGWTFLELSPHEPGIAAALREVFALHPDEPWYGLIADDNTVETDGFEVRLVTAAGAWGIASANDGWQARADVQVGRMHGAQVIGGDLMRELGYWAPEGFRHLYLDDVWETIGRELGNWRTLMDVHTPHQHPMKTGQPMDATHAAANADMTVVHDATCFRRWLADEAPADIERARFAMWGAQGLSLDRARQRSVMLAFPVYERPHHQHEASAMQTVGLLTRLGIHHGFCHVHAQPVHTARNLLAKAFLDSDFTDLLFIDADMAWRPWDVVRLLAQPHPFIGGVGRKRNDLPDTDPRAWCMSPIADAGGLAQHDAAGAFEVRHVGTGFQLINRLVFDAIERHGEPDRVTDADGAAYTRFFRWGFEGGAEVGEDYGFCHAYRSIGGKVMADPSIELSHFGTREHRARLLTILA